MVSSLCSTYSPDYIYMYGVMELPCWNELQANYQTCLFHRRGKVPRMSGGSPGSGVAKGIKYQIARFLAHCNFSEWYLILTFQKLKREFSISDLSTLSATIYHQTVPVLKKKSCLCQCSFIHAVTAVVSSCVQQACHVYQSSRMAGAHEVPPRVEKLLSIGGFLGKGQAKLQLYPPVDGSSLMNTQVALSTLSGFKRNSNT